MTTYAIIAAAGSGKRMGLKINKIFLLLKTEPIICHTIRKFQNSAIIKNIIIVTRKEDILEIKKIIAKNKFSKVTDIIVGGKDRQSSVFEGLQSLKDTKENDIVVIHNAVNSLVTERTITNCVLNAKKFGACIAGFKAKDTIKKVDRNSFVEKTIDRTDLYQIQTPQAFKYKIILEAYNMAKKDGYNGTDDAVLVERLGNKVKVIECSEDNIKITNSKDLTFVKKISQSTRIGFGMDSHRFTLDTTKKLILGGIKIENHNGFEANSDGDVIIHSLFNAISQALGERSLGFYADDLCKEGIKDSSFYIHVILDKMVQQEYEIGNIGIMCEGKEPRILDYESKIKDKIAHLCRIEIKKIGLTATSGEDLTAFGRGKGMQCFCVVLLNKI